LKFLPYVRLPLGWCWRVFFLMRLKLFFKAFGKRDWLLTIFWVKII
jgi:hypothetical protein